MFELVRLEGNTLPLPARGSKDAAGFDLQYAGKHTVIIPGRFSLLPNRKLLSSGFNVKIPDGYIGMVCSRSGLAAKNGVFVLNAPGIVDSDYRGEIKTTLCNSGETDFYVEPGMKIAQLLIVKNGMALHSGFLAGPKEVPCFSDTTERGENGFGSTGL